MGRPFSRVGEVAVKKTTEYERTRFPPDVIRQAVDVLFAGVERSKFNGTLSVSLGSEAWSHDTEEEFFADYRRSTGRALYEQIAGDSYLYVLAGNIDTTVEVRAPSRVKIAETFEIFDRVAPNHRLPDSPSEKPPVVFIGHGGSKAWRELKDHLQDKHGIEVEAYEVGARAGHAVRDVLDQMLNRSSFALLVMTKEDETADGNLRARQNVVHEAGLFQGRLGFHRAVVVVEEGTETFSNIEGIDQIRYSPGRIKECFGEVLATLRREFGPL
jgi:hypothetical protein